ncbi:AAA family ATPase [Marinactinospora rubrisoli]|uniref:AAA family ATPase n=1 Tax=Marinactinospora rubrisoli TaxID=2715399 RepID=A0ABW2KBK4_9ACTN
MTAYAADVERIAAAVRRTVLGKADVVRLALTALLSDGHILLEDVPGVGKTTLARAIAACVGADWRRIQFTPDLLPSDVTGVTVFNQAEHTFEFHPGPVFAAVVIADEINRASPKTQAALLEVMEERHVTVDGVRHPVPEPFLVVATQNPVEMDGTYRLPEAQLDRFLVRLSLGYLDSDAELAVLRGERLASPDDLEPVTDTAGIARLAAAARRVHIHDAIFEYVLRLAQATRSHSELRVGLSTRATLALTGAARTAALADGRPFVVPEDVKRLAVPVWAHRLVLTSEAAVGGRDAATLLAEVLDDTPAPQPVRTVA